MNNELNCSEKAQVYYPVLIRTVSLDESEGFIVEMQQNNFWNWL